MINFFRKTRHSLLNQGKTAKYAKYAIGEILLVVIGILIALQINTWNENKKNAFEHQFHLSKLKDSLSSDASSLQQKLQLDKVMIKSLKYCIEVLQTESIVSKKEFFKRYQYLSTTQNFYRNKSSFEAMVSTGKISLIEDQNLLSKLFNYYDNKEFIILDDRFSAYTRNVSASYIFAFDAVPEISQSSVQSQNEDIDLSKYSTPSKTMEEYRKDVFILNAIRVKLLFAKAQRRNYSELLSETNTLLSMISKELEQ